MLRDILSQNWFRAIFFDLKAKVDVRGGQRKAKNKAKNAAKRVLFCRSFPRMFCACFSAVRMATVTEKRSPEILTQKCSITPQFNRECRPVGPANPNNVAMWAAKKISKSDFFFNSQLCTPLPAKEIPKSPREIITSHNVLESLKQALVASRDVIHSSQIFGSKLQLSGPLNRLNTI